MTGKLDPNAGVPLDDVVLVFDESGALLQRLLHGPGVDQPLASEDGSGDVLWFLADNQGTIPDVAEYDDVAANISMVMAGIDPQTKAFTEPKIAIEKEIEEVKADKSIPEKEKKQMLDELAEALKSAQPVANPGNIELVKKYFDKLDAVLQ